MMVYTDKTVSLLVSYVLAAADETTRISNIWGTGTGTGTGMQHHTQQTRRSNNEDRSTRAEQQIMKITSYSFSEEGRRRKGRVKEYAVQ